MVTQTVSAANRKIAVFLNVKDAQGLLAFLISGQDALDLELEQRWRGAIVEALAAEEKTTGVKMGVSRVSRIAFLLGFSFMAALTVLR